MEGSLVLLGGEPGIGKSTLSLQLPLGCPGLKTLYVTGEVGLSGEIRPVPQCDRRIAEAALAVKTI